jgi:hypothetical protein
MEEGIQMTQLLLLQEAGERNNGMDDERDRDMTMWKEV